MNIVEAVLKAAWVVLSNGWPMFSLMGALIVLKKIFERVQRFRR